MGTTVGHSKGGQFNSVSNDGRSGVFWVVEEQRAIILGPDLGNLGQRGVKGSV